MGKRRDPRMPATLQIRMAGTDASGRPVLQVVSTINISRQGALLEGVQSAFRQGEIVSLSYKNNKARFRVIWVGEPRTVRAGQMGVQSIDPAKCIWDAAILPTTTPDTYAAPAPKERRQHRRISCRLGAELYVQGAETVVRVQVTNISMGGCFLEMPTLAPEKARAKIVIWSNDSKLIVQGIVVSRRPGFGVSIKFTEMTEEVRAQLHHFVQAHSLRRD
jgi:hypothetical protein